MSICKVMGIEKGTYKKKDTGEVKQKQILHVVWEDKVNKDLVGQLVESIFIPQAIALSFVRVGGRYKLVYSANGRYARLDSIEEVK